MASKSDIAAVVASAVGITGVAAKEAVDATLGAIAATIASGERLQLAGIGAFSVKETKARTSRNPRTGEAIAVPAGKKATFKASADLKARL